MIILNRNRQDRRSNLLAFALGVVAGIAVLCLSVKFAYGTSGTEAGPAKPGLDLFYPEHLSIDTWRNAYRNDPYIPDKTGQWTGGGRFNLHFRLLHLLRWENHLHMDGIEQRLASAGWESTLYLDWWDRVQPFYYHHSEHSLDERTYPLPLDDWKFPQTDRYGVRWCAWGCE